MLSLSFWKQFAVFCQRRYSPRYDCNIDDVSLSHNDSFNFSFNHIYRVRIRSRCIFNNRSLPFTSLCMSVFCNSGERKPGGICGKNNGDPQTAWEEASISWTHAECSGKGHDIRLFREAKLEAFYMLTNSDQTSVTPPCDIYLLIEHINGEQSHMCVICLLCDCIVVW